MRMSLVIDQLKVLVLELKNRPHRRVELHLRQRIWLPGKLGARLFDVVAVQVHIPESVDEVARCQPAHLRHHLRQQGIGSDVKGHPQEDIRRALV